MNLLGYEHSCNSPRIREAESRRRTPRSLPRHQRWEALFRRVSRWEGLGQRHDREGRLACSAEDPLCASDSHPLRHPILAWRRYLAGCSFSYTAGVPFAVIFAMPHEADSCPQQCVLSVPCEVHFVHGSVLFCSAILSRSLVSSCVARWRASSSRSHACFRDRSFGFACSTASIR